MARKLAAPVIALVALAAICWGLYHAIEVGSCGSSANYVTTRPPCPSGEVFYILAIVFGSIFLLPAILFASFGRGILACIVPIAAGATLILTGTHHSGVGAILSYAFGGTLAAIGVLPLFLMAIGRARQAAPEELRASGQKGVGVVLRAQAHGQNDDGEERVSMAFRIYPMNGAGSFEAERTRNFPLGSAPRVGDRYQVWFNANDRGNWDYGDRLGPNEQLPPGMDTQATSAPAAVAAAGGDPLDRLAKLQDLHTRGAITDAEFTQKKAELLDEV